MPDPTTTGDRAARGRVAAPGESRSPQQQADSTHDHSHAHTTDWREQLRAKGYRLTPQRELILGAIDDLGHATPDEVLAHVQARASSVNASTVYRTLEVLEDLGLVRHAHLSDRAPTYHSVGGHEHFHLKCRACGEVVSMGVESAAALTDLLEREHGFVADVGHLTVFGRCAACIPAMD